MRFPCSPSVTKQISTFFLCCVAIGKVPENNWEQKTGWLRLGKRVCDLRSEQAPLEELSSLLVIGNICYLLIERDFNCRYSRTWKALNFLCRNHLITFHFFLFSPRYKEQRRTCRTYRRNLAQCYRSLLESTWKFSKGKLMKPWNDESNRKAMEVIFHTTKTSTRLTRPIFKTNLARKKNSISQLAILTNLHMTCWNRDTKVCKLKIDINLW